MSIDCHHVAYVCGVWMKIPILKKKYFFLEDWDFFFKIGKNVSNIPLGSGPNLGPWEQNKIPVS